jgi:hypothetical protein
MVVRCRRKPKQQDASAPKQQDASAPKQQEESAPKQQDASASALWPRTQQSTELLLAEA